MDFILGDKDKTLKNLLLSIILAVIIGFIIGKLSPFYGIVLILFLVFISMTISNMCYGILFWILTGGIFVFPIYSVRNAGIYPSIVILSILLCFWIFIFISKGVINTKKSKLFWPLIFLIICTVLSFLKGNMLYDINVIGQHRYFLVNVFASITIIFSILTALLIRRFFRTTQHVRLIYSALIILGIEVIVYVLFKLDRFGLKPNWYPMMQAHSMALVYASLIFMPELSLLKKIGSVILIIFSFEFIIWQFLDPEKGQWIAGWIVIGIPLIYITYCRSKKWCAFLLILFSVLIFTMGYSLFKDMFAKAEQERDYDRFIIWASSIKIWLKEPFFGISPGNYFDYSLTYADPKFAYGSAHNQYFQILTELGGLGIICFFWLIGKIYFLGKYLIQTVKDNFLRVFVIGIMGSIYGQLGAGFVADYILPAYHNGGHQNFCTTIYFWILVGSLMAVEQIVIKEEQQASECRV